MTPTLVNTGEAQWLPGSAPSRGVILHTSAGDLPLAASLAPLQRTAIGPLTVTMGRSAMALSGTPENRGAGDFGEVLNLTLVVDSTVRGVPDFCESRRRHLGFFPGRDRNHQDHRLGRMCLDSVSGPALDDVRPAQGAGNGTVTYTVQANYGPKRQATIRIGNYAFTVTEDGASILPGAGSHVIAASLNFGKRTVGASGARTNRPTDQHRHGVAEPSGDNPRRAEQRRFRGDEQLWHHTGARRTLHDPGDASHQRRPESGRHRCSLPAILAEARLPSIFPVPASPPDPLPPFRRSSTPGDTPRRIAPGLWVTIGGTNLAGPPQTWNLDGVQELPVYLGGATVTFNGAPAALLYVSPTQINALVPAGVASGKVQVVAQVNGLSSSPFTITAQPAQPAVYAPPTADAATFFVTAALAGTATLVGNSATDPRVVRPVYPGDTLDLYMIGLGATLDPSKFVTDRVFSGAFPVSAPVTATVGGEPANVLFAGLTAPGLYLVRIVVPSDLAAGAQPLQVSAGGIQTRPSLVLQMAAAPAAVIFAHRRTLWLARRRQNGFEVPRPPEHAPAGILRQLIQKLRGHHWERIAPPVNARDRDRK